MNVYSAILFRIIQNKKNIAGYFNQQCFNYIKNQPDYT